MALLRAAERVSWEHELVPERYAGGSRSDRPPDRNAPLR